MGEERFLAGPPEEAASLGGIPLDRRLSRCSLCRALVPTVQLAEHLLGDKLVLEIIRLNNPHWTHQECLDYYVKTYRPGVRGSSGRRGRAS